MKDNVYWYRVLETNPNRAVKEQSTHPEIMKKRRIKEINDTSVDYVARLPKYLEQLLSVRRR